MTHNITIPHNQWHLGWWLQGSDKIQYNHDGQAIYLNYTWPDCSPTSCDVLFLVDHKQRVTHCRKAYPAEGKPYAVTMIAEAPDISKALSEAAQAKKQQADKLTEAYKKFQLGKAADMVNHPPHYNQPGQPEVWEQMVALFGKDAYINFARLSAFKYRMRAGYKQDAAEDIRKAMWYEKKIQELTNNQ